MSKLNEEQQEKIRELKARLEQVPEGAKEVAPVLFAVIKQALMELEDDDDIADQTVIDLKNELIRLLQKL